MHLRSVPRHLFVPEEYAHIAYSDGPLPIGHGQTISQPYIVALMTELLELEGEENVLEVGHRLRLPGSFVGISGPAGTHHRTA